MTAKNLLKILTQTAEQTIIGIIFEKFDILFSTRQNHDYLTVAL
jgi:hypothetical protein